MMRVNIYQNNRKHSLDDWRWHGSLFAQDNSTLATCKAQDRDTCEAMIDAAKSWLANRTTAEHRGQGRSNDG